MLLVQQCHTHNNGPFQILASNNDDDEDTVVASNGSPRLPPPSLPPSDNPMIPPARPRTRQLANQPTNPPSTLQLSCLPEAPSPSVLTIPASYITTITPTALCIHIHDLRPTQPRMHSKPPTTADRPTHALPIVEPDDERDEVPTGRAATPPAPLHPNHYLSNPMQHFTPIIVSRYWTGIH